MRCDVATWGPAERWRRVAIITTLVTVLLPGEAVAATATETFRDEFNVISYSGNDGTLDWAAPWAEEGESDGPDSGVVRVVSDSRCVSTNCLRIGGNEASISGRGAQRGADLSGAASATLTFSYQRRLPEDEGGSITLAVYDGSKWTELMSYEIDDSDSGPVAQSFDISPYMSSDTRIRFLGSGGDEGSSFYVDDVEISAEYEANAAPSFDQDLGDRSDPEGASVSIDSGATDPDGDTLTYSATGLPPGISIKSSTGLITGTIDYSAADASPYSVKVTVTDGKGGSDTDTFTWKITNTNRAPKLDPVPDQEVDEGTTASFTASATDPDGDSLTFSLDGAPSGATIDAATGAFKWTPKEAQGPGTYTFDIVVTDDGSPASSDTVSVTITVNEVNQAPKLTSPGNQTDTEGDTVTLAIAADDPDTPANPLTYKATGLPPGLSIDPSTGSISGTISDNASTESPYAVKVSVDDGSGGSDAETFTWTVTAASSVSSQDPVGSSPDTQEEPGGDLGPAGGARPDQARPAIAAADDPASLSTTIKAGVMADLTSLERVPATEAEPRRGFDRTLVLMARAASSSLETMGLPLVFLGLLGGGLLTMGRFTVLPMVVRRDGATGTVRLYDPELRYGLITPDDNSPDVFFHQTAIRPRHLTSLSTGDRVEYQADADPNRAVARRARLLDPNPSSRHGWSPTTQS